MLAAVWQPHAAAAKQLPRHFRFWLELSDGPPSPLSTHPGNTHVQQVPRQVAVSHKSSNDSSPNTSTSGSPVREASTSAGPDGKPRMNARQRRTERRRREREIKAIQDHVDAGQAALGGVLLGEERRLYDFQMSEVRDLPPLHPLP